MWNKLSQLSGSARTGSSFHTYLLWAPNRFCKCLPGTGNWRLWLWRFQISRDVKLCIVVGLVVCVGVCVGVSACVRCEYAHEQMLQVCVRFLCPVLFTSKEASTCVCSWRVLFADLSLFILYESCLVAPLLIVLESPMANFICYTSSMFYVLLHPAEMAIDKSLWATSALQKKTIYEDIYLRIYSCPCD
jgi:hypothetical protein